MPSLRSLTRVRTIPFWLLLELVQAANAQWRELSDEDREELTRLLRKSKGRPSNLTGREREKLRRIASQLDPKRLVLDMVPGVGKRSMR